MSNLLLVHVCFGFVSQDFFSLLVLPWHWILTAFPSFVRLLIFPLLPSSWLQVNQFESAFPINLKEIYLDFSENSLEIHVEKHCKNA
jgi:hypothetical protein